MIIYANSFAENKHKRLPLLLSNYIDAIKMKNPLYLG